VHFGNEDVIIDLNSKWTKMSLRNMNLKKGGKKLLCKTDRQANWIKEFVEQEVGRVPYPNTSTSTSHR